VLLFYHFRAAVSTKTAGMRAIILFSKSGNIFRAGTLFAGFAVPGHSSLPVQVHRRVRTTLPNFAQNGEFFSKRGNYSPTWGNILQKGGHLVTKSDIPGERSRTGRELADIPSRREFLCISLGKNGNIAEKREMQKSA
jgi:hypothetical protein